MVDIDTSARNAMLAILGVDHVAPYVQRKARIQCIIIDALKAFASATAPDRGAVTNDPIREAIDRGGGQCCDVEGVLRELTTAGYVIAPVKDDPDVISYFYVKQGYIFKRPVRTDAGVTMGFPVCLVCDGVDAEQVCAILNRGEPATG